MKRLNKNILVNFWTTLILVFVAQSTISCSSSSSGGNSATGKVEGANDPESQAPRGPANKRCEFKVTSMPADLNSYIPSGVEEETQAAFQNYDCKIIAVAFSKTQAKFVVARYADAKLDDSFGNHGVEIHEFLKNEYWVVGKLYFVEMPDKILMVGAAKDKDSAGFAVAAFDFDGNFRKDDFYNGAGYVNVYRRPRSGTSCTRFSLDISAITPLKDQIKVDGLFSTICSNEEKPVSRVIGTKFPDLVDLKKEIPVKCAHLNYHTSGAINNEAHQFVVSKDCKKINVEYDFLGLALGVPSWSESIQLDMTGKCSKSKRFGYSCFYYEDDYLVRESVDRYWQLKKSFLKIVKDSKDICGVYGSSGTYMVESPLPPTNPNFYNNCNYY